MADDRVWLVCTTCKDKILLAEHWAGFPLGILYPPITDIDGLFPWLTKHLNHHPASRSGASTLGGNPGLKVVTDYCEEVAGEGMPMQSTWVDRAILP